MKVNSSVININSEQPERLAAFYSDVVQLPRLPGMEGPLFDIGGGHMLAIDGHSEVHGAAKDAPRVILSLFVDDLASEQKRLEDQGVRFLHTAGREYWGGVISTFADPDSNLVQFIEFQQPANG
ncbi:MAG: VOC family protein [Dehalococcoidia bacterium]|nr:VOC family protein [Dehalococcoidia bacterium]